MALEDGCVDFSGGVGLRGFPQRWGFLGEGRFFEIATCDIKKVPLFLKETTILSNT
jgi:hypothetical protein